MRLLLFALIAGVAPAALALEAYKPPRTADGHPDFSGTWSTSFMTLLERPPFFKTLVLTEEEARKGMTAFTKGVPDLVDPDFYIQNIQETAKVRGEYRSSLLVLPADGKMPYTDKSRKLIEHAEWMDAEAHDHPEERPKYDRCLAGSGQPPMRPFAQTLTHLFVQTPREIVVATEDVGSPRIINFDGAPPPAAVATYEGWSRGRWDGDTLVVETTNMRAEDPARPVFGGFIMVEPDSRLVERFTRVAHDELLYQFTVEDADLYTAPWLVEYSFTLQDTGIYEYACHEANYSMVNILLGGREHDKREAAKGKGAKKPK